MQYRTTLTVTSLLSTILFMCHWSDEISRGFERGDFSSLGGVAILVVWFSGPLVLGARRSGYVLMLVGGILGLAVLVLHMSGHGMVGGKIANTSGQFFWVFTLLALGSMSSISAILAATALWNSRRRHSP